MTIQSPETTSAEPTWVCWVSWRVRKRYAWALAPWEGRGILLLGARSSLRRSIYIKVDFAVLVPTLPQAGYPFPGMRLNYFLDRLVAEMEYASGSHVLSFLMFSDQGITLSAMPSERLGSRTVYGQTYKGYTTIFWQDGVVLCGLVSDRQQPALMEALTCNTMRCDGCTAALLLAVRG